MRTLGSIAVSLLCALLISSCAALSVNDLPQPGNSYRDGYDIVLEFANVLNLPDRAKVVMDGTNVGVVEKDQTVDFTVDAYPTRTFHGNVVQVRNAPITVQNVVTYDTVIGVGNADLKLKPGMTANVQLETPR